MLGADVDEPTRRATRSSTPPTATTKLEAPYELVKTMRASVLVLGPLVARYGRARVSLPGGCAIGARPIDQHLKGLEAMGAKITLDARLRRRRGQAAARRDDRARHADRDRHREPDDGGGARARAARVIENAAREPEVEELARVLNKMGARIQGAGTPRHHDRGRRRAAPDRARDHPRSHRGRDVRWSPPRSPAATCCSRDALPEHLDAVIAKLRAAGAEVAAEADGLRVRGDARASSRSTSSTQPYPGFPTDMQAQFMVLHDARARAVGASRRRSSRTATCTCRSWRAWAPTSTSTGAPRSCAAAAS